MIINKTIDKERLNGSQGCKSLMMTRLTLSTTKDNQRGIDELFHLLNKVEQITRTVTGMVLFRPGGQKRLGQH